MYHSVLHNLGSLHSQQRKNIPDLHKPSKFEYPGLHKQTFPKHSESLTADIHSSCNSQASPSSFFGDSVVISVELSDNGLPISKRI